MSTEPDYKPQLMRGKKTSLTNDNEVLSSIASLLSQAFLLAAGSGLL